MYKFKKKWKRNRKLFTGILLLLLRVEKLYSTFFFVKTKWTFCENHNHNHHPKKTIEMESKQKTFYSNQIKGIKKKIKSCYGCSSNQKQKWKLWKILLFSKCKFWKKVTYFEKKKIFQSCRWDCCCCCYGIDFFFGIHALEWKSACVCVCVFSMHHNQWKIFWWKSTLTCRELCHVDPKKAEKQNYHSND